MSTQSKDRRDVMPVTEEERARNVAKSALAASPGGSDWHYVEIGPFRQEVCAAAGCAVGTRHDLEGTPKPLQWPDRSWQPPGSRTAADLARMVTEQSSVPQKGAEGGQSLLGAIRAAVGAEDGRWGDDTGDGCATEDYLDRLSAAALHSVAVWLLTSLEPRVTS